MSSPETVAAPRVRFRSWMILAGALAFGGIAVFAASRYISTTISAERARLNPNVETIPVVVAKSALERGAIVSSQNMAVRAVPKDYAPGTAVSPDEFVNVEGARLAVDMRAGEVLLRGTLEGADISTFSTKIRNGVRAMTVAVDEVNSISGLLQPGDRVDLFFTAKPPNRRPATERTMLLMQDVLILATGRKVRPIVGEEEGGVGRAFTTITIESSPHDAQRLILAQKTGGITAVLRGPEDKESLTAAAMDASALFGSPVRASAGRSRRAEVIVGGGGRMSRESVWLPALADAATPKPAAPADAEGARLVRDLARAIGSAPAEAASMAR